MEKADILHLASLARIAVTATEVEKFQTEISSILDYVGQIQSLTANLDTPKKVGAVYNKMRADVVTHQSGEYTKPILREMPAKVGNFMKVKKILTNDE